ncbi:hypothetical protein BD309DRAFT_860503, partial [Dichomitus squalens]
AGNSRDVETQAEEGGDVADNVSGEVDADVEMEEYDAEADDPDLELDNDGDVLAPETNQDPWYLAPMIWERPAEGVDIFCFDPDLSVAWYLETVLWVDSDNSPKIHFLSIPFVEGDIVLKTRPNLGLVLRHLDITCIEVWKVDICSWVEQAVTTPIHVYDDKLLLLRLPDVGYCQGFTKFLERMESDPMETDEMASMSKKDGRFSWEEKGKNVDRADNK